ncbi:MAG: PAS domain-containing protein [Thermodesulfobacteriota bacterium]
MNARNRLFSNTSILFIITAALLILLNNLTRSGTELPTTLLTFLLLGILLTTSLYLCTRELKIEQEKNVNYRTRLKASEEELEDIQRSHEETVERRTFEISVVNASLNREIAERIQAENETKALQQQMELILESAGEGIFGLDTDGKVTFINKAASLMLGWEPEEIVGGSHHDLVHHSHPDGSHYPVEECPIHQAYKDGKVHFGSNEVFWTRDDTGFKVEYTSTPIVEKTKIRGAVVVFRDANTFV